MKLLQLSLLFILFGVRAVPPTDPIDKVADLLRHGNIHELSSMFASNLELTILNEQDTYSKVQAEVVLNKFFSENKPKAFKILHKVNSNPNYRFAVILLTTDKGIFRVAYTLRESAGSLMLIELRIETEKVK